MGGSVSSIDAKLLEEYEECTFFTRKEIIHVFNVFYKMGQEYEENKANENPETWVVSCDRILQMHEFKCNTFASRMIAVFADGQDEMAFEDFLDMASVFSEHATRDVKASYAFRIYDFDGDGYLGHDDLEKTVVCLVGEGNLTPDQIQETVHQILLESDLDEDNQLSFIEFEHVVSRAPDFANTFRIRI